MTEQDLAVLAKMAGLAIDPAHAPGVTRNLAILFDQAALLGQAPVGQLVEPAPVYRP